MSADDRRIEDYSLVELGELVDRMANTIADPTERRRIWAQYQQRLREDRPDVEMDMREIVAWDDAHGRD